MQELTTQLQDQCPACSHRFLHLTPFTDSDREELKGFKLFQPIRTKLQKIMKPRSLIQLRAYWKACTIIGEMISDHEHQRSKEWVDFQVKIKVAEQAPQLIKYFYSLDGIMHVQTISISFENLSHILACRFFDYGFQVLADMGNVSLEELKHTVGMKDE